MSRKKLSFQVELFSDNPFLVVIHLRREIDRMLCGLFGLIGKRRLLEEETAPTLLRDLASIKGVRHLSTYQNEVHLGIGKAFNRPGDLERITQEAVYALQSHLVNDLVRVPVVKPGDFTHSVRSPTITSPPISYGFEDVFP